MAETKRAGSPFWQRKDCFWRRDSNPPQPLGSGYNCPFFVSVLSVPGIFLLLSPSPLKNHSPPSTPHPPQALDQSAEHQVSPHNLSLKGIIIRSLGPEAEKYEGLLSLDKWNTDAASRKGLRAIRGRWRARGVSYEVA